MRIRPIALCLLENEGRVLLQKFRHEPGGYWFFRPPGGGIEYGEPAAEAVRREMMEELGAEISSPELVSVFENLFEYGGEQKHEIVFLFRAQLLDSQFFEQDEFEFFDNGFPFVAAWVPGAEIVSGQHIVYPVGVADWLKNVP